LEIVRAADAFTTVPPKSPSEHHEQDKIQKTTTVVISKHTLDTNPTTPTTPAALPIGAAPLLPPESATVAQTQTQQQQQQQQQQSKPRRNNKNRNNHTDQAATTDNTIKKEGLVNGTS